jgi:4-aminobutyrate aminotransferase-like enzyme
MLAAMTRHPEITNKVILKCQEKGLILFWLLFEGCAIRITPPLTVSENEIKKAAPSSSKRWKKCLQKLTQETDCQFAIF